MVVRLDAPTPDLLVAQFKRAPEDVDSRAELRRVALRNGWWAELAVRLPEHFQQAFELVGTERATIAPPVRVAPPPAVPDSTLQKLASQDAFIRILRADGRTDIVAGKLGDIYPTEEIMLKTFDPDATEKLRQPGDVPIYRKNLQRGAMGIVLWPGDRVVTALKLPLDYMGVAPAGTLKRTSLRERAEAVARGEYAPRVDLTNPQAFLVPMPAHGSGITGTPQSMLDADFVAAVKVEQNVLATPLVHDIVRRAIDRMQQPGFAARLGEIKTWHALGNALLEHMVKPTMEDAVADWKSKPHEPLGQAYANLGRVIDFSYAFIPNTLPKDMTSSAQGLLRAGLLTAVSALVDMGAVSHALTKDRPDVSASDVLRTSTPTLLRLASAHMEVFLAMHAVLHMGAKSDMPQFFELTERNGKFRAEPSAAALKTLAETYGLRPETILPGTTGCPAAQSMGGGNPVQQLTDAFATLVSQLPAVPS